MNIKNSTLLTGTRYPFETYMEFSLWDGTEGYFNFDWCDDWIETIDGVPVYEYFVDLPQFG